MKQVIFICVLAVLASCGNSGEGTTGQNAADTVDPGVITNSGAASTGGVGAGFGSGGGTTATGSKDLDSTGANGNADSNRNDQQ